MAWKESIKKDVYRGGRKGPILGSKSKKEDFNLENEKKGMEILLTKAVNIGLRNQEELLREVNEYGDFEFTKEDVTRAAEILAKAIQNHIY